MLAGTLESVVVASSIEVYGAPRYLPVDETHPTDPSTAYGIAKLAGEHTLAIGAMQTRIPLAVLRLAFVFGPGQHAANVIPRFLEQARSGRPPVIHGDGRAVRDDVYVGDVAEAVVIALDRRADGVYNIASGRPHTLDDVARTVCRVSSVGVPQNQPKISTWIDRWFDVSRARTELGWEPRTGFEEAIGRMWAGGAR
jgi:UDP-glucose 4-epimerase